MRSSGARTGCGRTTRGSEVYRKRCAIPLSNLLKMTRFPCGYIQRRKRSRPKFHDEQPISNSARTRSSKRYSRRRPACRAGILAFRWRGRIHRDRDLFVSDTAEEACSGCWIGRSGRATRAGTRRHACAARRGSVHRCRACGRRRVHARIGRAWRQVAAGVPRRRRRARRSRRRRTTRHCLLAGSTARTHCWRLGRRSRRSSHLPEPHRACRRHALRATCGRRRDRA